MFEGSIPVAMRSVVHEVCASWGDDVWVACSGNFTIERVLSSTVPRLHGNDVTLYSCALGWWAAHQDVMIAPLPGSPLEWVRPWLEDPDDRIASIMLLTRFADSYRRLPNRWHERNIRGYLAQWEDLHARTKAKVVRAREGGFALESFSARDCVEWLALEVPADGPVVSFPPFDRGGYETMWRGLTDNLDWPAPEYEEFDPDDAEKFLATVTDRRHWLLGLGSRRPEWEGYLAGVVQNAARNRPIWVYHSGETLRSALPVQRVEPVLMPRYVSGGIGGPLTLHPLSAGQFAALRSKYLDPRIVPARAEVMLAVASEGQVLGVLAFSLVTHGAGHEHKDLEGYLLADFAVAPTDQPRLSRLVVAAAHSTEVRRLLERRFNHAINTIQTAAFSDHPASMKYRWAMDCAKRTRTPGAAHEWELLYRGKAGRWTLAEVLERWKQSQERSLEDAGTARDG